MSVATADAPEESVRPPSVSTSPLPVYSTYGVFVVSPICASSASSVSVIVSSAAENAAAETVMSSAALFVAPSLPSGSTIQLDADSAVVAPANFASALSVRTISVSDVVDAVNDRAVGAGTSTRRGKERLLEWLSCSCLLLRFSMLTVCWTEPRLTLVGMRSVAGAVDVAGVHVRMVSAPPLAVKFMLVSLPG